jgi:hypothetical protein
MCFLDQHQYVCGDWKWGHFRQHYAKEYKIGETCGMKLILQTIPTGRRCKLCEKIDIKMKRHAAEVDRIERWQRVGQEFGASIEKSEGLVKGLDEEIQDFNDERECQQSEDVSQI